MFLFDFLLYFVGMISVCTKSWICNMYNIYFLHQSYLHYVLIRHLSTHNFPFPLLVSPIEEYTQYNLMKICILTNQLQINHWLELRHSLDLPPQLYNNVRILHTSEGEMQQRAALQKTNEVLTSSNAQTQILIFLYICPLALLLSLYISLLKTCNKICYGQDHLLFEKTIQPKISKGQSFIYQILMWIMIQKDILENKIGVNQINFGGN